MQDNTEIVIVEGLCWKKRVGKDTIGNHLVEKYGFYRLAFADLLKKGLSGDFWIVGRPNMGIWQGQLNVINNTNL